MPGTCLPRKVSGKSPQFCLFCGNLLQRYRCKLVNIHKLHLFPQICEITMANDSIIGKKRGNIDKKFPQSIKISSDSV